MDRQDALRGEAAWMAAGFTGLAGPEGAWLSSPIDRLAFPAGEEAGAFARIGAFVEQYRGNAHVAGYISYECAEDLEPTLRLPRAPGGLPTCHLVAYEALEPASAPTRDAASILRVEGVSRPTARGFEASVERVVTAIKAGEIFQANISQKSQAHVAASDPHRSAIELFARMIATRVAPYAAYLPMAEGAVLSNSPELFLEIMGGHIAAEPIKGTAPREADPEADRQAAEALLSSEKDRAENIMIADLLRNDLAKVCDDTSVRVTALCAHRALAKIHHLYSRIEGRLRPGVTSTQALAAAFPCGSVTGAPKHRAMQVIAAEEGEGRGVYCGTILYAHKERYVASVPIRTLQARHEEGGLALSYRAGGGITALSEPQAEYQEALAKAYGFEAILA